MGSHLEDFRMSSSDEEGEIFPDCVANYEFVNQANEHVSLSSLPLLLQKDDVVNSGNTRVFLSGYCDDGLQKIYKEVLAWRYELSCVQPEISVLCKDKRWAKLLKPKRLYEAEFRSILITVHCLHFVKHNLEAAEQSMWSHLSRVTSNYEVSPSEVDCMNHLSLIRDAVEHDITLKVSKFMRKILSGQPIKRKLVQEEGSPSGDFIADDDTDDLCEDDELCEQEDELFDTCCSFCDNGGDILTCEGRCMRSFHASKVIGDFGEESCEGLGLSEAQVKAIPNFICKNCQRQRHQCFVCGKLGSSDISSNAEVFPCVAGNCGRFYHPKCVHKELQQRTDTQIENLEKKIAAGESFICPAHRCFVCKQLENRTVLEMQFAVCRRCPKSYHRKCLPREIHFGEGAQIETLPRAWDGLLPKRVLIYCLDHEIDPDLGTPLRNHICFPSTSILKRNILDQHSRGLDCERKKSKLDHCNRPNETAIGMTKTQAGTGSTRLVDKRIGGPSFDGEKKAYSSKLISSTTGNLKSLPKPNPSSTVIRADPNNSRYIAEKKMPAVKPGNVSLNSRKLDDPHLPKPLVKKQGRLCSVVDIELERRITCLIEDVNSSFDADEFMKQQKITSMYNMNSKDVLDKNLTKGKVEAAVKAIREALQKLDNGGSVDDAKAVCSVEMLLQVPLWKNKLRLYLGPFLHGMHYSSFGRHFTKSEKLQEIVNRLHSYVQDGDMIVDFCCGANEFSCLMKEKLDSAGKTKCLYKNFDLFPPKNDFNFEQRDWFTVDPKDLRPGAQLIMGLNPPFGYKATLANKFINKALQFKPKLLILIVPPETQRLDSRNRKKRYDLLWDDQELLAGEAFYLPGAFDAHDKQISQWNNITPPLYLWSRPDWTQRHKEIASRCGHPVYRGELPSCPLPSSNYLSEEQEDVHGDFIDVYSDLPSVVPEVSGPIYERELRMCKPDENYSHYLSSTYARSLSYGHNGYNHNVSNVNSHNMTYMDYSASGAIFDNYGNVRSFQNLGPTDMAG